jgi:hypothetical protein
MRVYSLANNTTILSAAPLFSGIEVTGLAKGDDAITAERNVAAAEYEVGCDGHMVISLSSDRSGKVTLKLQPTSSTNKILMANAAAMDVGSASFVPVSLRSIDTRRQDVVVGTVGFIEKIPAVKKGSKYGDLEWVFIFEQLFFQFGDPMGAGTPSALAERLG